MSNQKSIIGCGYIPLEMQAVCLKTNMNTNLGDIVYKIITAPYERVFVRKNLFDLTPKECKRMAVDVVDVYSSTTSTAIRLHSLGVKSKRFLRTNTRS